MGDRRKMIKKEMGKEQKNEPFAIKPFYDMLHSTSYAKPTYFTMNVSSSSPKNDAKGETTTSSTASPSRSEPEDITSIHGDNKTFQITIADSYANYLFAMTLPYRLGMLLPYSDMMATFVCEGKSHRVKFFGKRKLKMFGSGWRQFAEEHHLAGGDRLLFNINEKSDKKLKLRVSILKRSVSSTMHEQKRGTIDCPIDILNNEEEEEEEDA